jgi:hypothetical protein
VGAQAELMYRGLSWAQGVLMKCGVLGAADACGVVCDAAMTPLGDFVMPP